MGAVVTRIEALPGEGRYVVIFDVPGGGEQAAVAEVRADTVVIAPASLPVGWEVDSAAHDAIRRALLALHEARSVAPAVAALSDVDGGWDVGLGNVALGDDGGPVCVAHGALQPDGADGVWVCPECGARARLD